MIVINPDSDSVFHLQGTIEHFEAVICKKNLNSCLETVAGKNIEIDLSGLESVNSITLSFLLFGLRSAKLFSCKLNYKNIPPSLFNMARVSGIESILIH